ncbi:MAG: GNAT family N-acetyltransferase [Legionella sp.]|nr:MAG: GNAT family N-acetyltransferase [Legionella sp.]PJD97375.1 MAG: GNAT family N-acetyltransferase [Legionella sp.]
MKKKLHASVRLATIEDADALSMIHVASWQKAFKEYIPESLLIHLPLTGRPELWQEALKKGALVYVVEVKEQLVGLMSIVLDSESCAAKGEINAIYLHPHYWHKGLGTQLWAFAVVHLKELGCLDIGIWVLEANDKTRAFYESLQFQNTGMTRLQAFYDNGPLLTELYYTKSLQ